jgi:ABC-2 type transport system permease protein
VAQAEAVPVYDSAQRDSLLLGTARRVLEYRGLIRLLVARDLTVRYKRSVLGAWWTLLNPLFTAAIFWVVFNNFLRPRIPGVPYIVYLISGLITVSFYSQGLIVTGNSMAHSASVLTKVYVPPEVFAVSAATAQAVNFFIALLPLLVIQVILGVGIPWTVVLVPLPALALLALVTGTGLLVATVAIRFQDVMDLIAVSLTMLLYATPTFYPISIVPERYRPLVKLNPLYWYVDVFRHVVYGGTVGPALGWLIIIVTSTGSLLLGVAVFAKRWKSLAVML